MLFAGKTHINEIFNCIMLIILYDCRNLFGIMRYEKGHKENTRRRIIETAATRFRRDGIDNVGVADLMTDAGLTHGGFYSHFRSKEDLVKAAIEEAGGNSLQRLQTRIKEGGVEAWIRFYLSAKHRDHPEAGCPAAALGPEISRHPKASRSAFTESVEKIVALVAKHLPDDRPQPQKRKTATTLFAFMIGTVQIARAVSNPAFSDQILEAGVDAALSIAGIKGHETHHS